MFEFIKRHRQRRKEYSAWIRSTHEGILERLKAINVYPEDVDVDHVLTKARTRMVIDGRVPEQEALIYAYYVVTAYKKQKLNTLLPAIKERANVSTQAIKDILDAFFTEPSIKVEASELSDLTYHLELGTGTPSSILAKLIRYRLIFETGFDYDVCIKNWSDVGPSIIAVKVKDAYGNEWRIHLNFHVSYEYNKIPFRFDTALELTAVDQFFERISYQRKLAEANRMADKPENQPCELSDTPLGLN